MELQARDLLPAATKHTVRVSADLSSTTVKMVAPSLFFPCFPFAHFFLPSLPPLLQLPAVGSGGFTIASRRVGTRQKLL